MSTWGGDGSSYANRVIVDTWDEFKKEFHSYSRQHIELSMTHEDGTLIPEEERVVDLRKSGWISSPHLNDNPGSGYSFYKYVYGYGWTILGLSVRDGYFWLFTKKDWGGGSINGFTFKNFYILSTGSTLSSIFRFDTNDSIRVTDCKFSGVIDGSSTNSINVGIFYKLAQDVRFSNCSFNLRIAAYSGVNGTSDNIKLYYDNCLFKIDARAYKGIVTSGTSEVIVNSKYILWGHCWFCLIKGKVTVKQISGNGLYLSSVLSGGDNVIDVEVSHFDPSQRLVNCYFNCTSTALNVFNKEKIGTTSIAKETIAADVLEVTNAQIIDKEYLNSQGFIVGDTPSV